MSKILKTMTLSFVMIFSLFVLAPVTSMAASDFDAFQDTCDGSTAASQSAVCKDKAENAGKSPFDSTTGIIPKVANIIAAVGGVIAVVFVMINGVTLLMSTGDSAKINKARDGLIYAAVGIVVIVMARVIVAFIMRFI